MFKIYCVGKLKNKNLISEINDLKKRISRFEIIELKEIKDKNPLIVRKKEAELLSLYLDKSNFNVLLFEEGIEYSTYEFYDKFKKIDRDICFFITGAYGVDNSFKNMVDLCLSLSKMIFTHEQALYMLVEQIYRYDCFRKNIDYTK